jgi:hypothetical protein
MGRLIYEKSVEALSEQAITVLAIEELKTPVSLRNVVNYGATILTNPGHLEKETNAIDRRDAKEEKELRSKIEKVKSKKKRINGR